MKTLSAPIMARVTESVKDQSWLAGMENTLGTILGTVESFKAKRKEILEDPNLSRQGKDAQFRALRDEALAAIDAVRDLGQRQADLEGKLLADGADQLTDTEKLLRYMQGKEIRDALAGQDYTTLKPRILHELDENPKETPILDALASAPKPLGIIPDADLKGYRITKAKTVHPRLAADLSDVLEINGAISALKGLAKNVINS